MKHHADLLDAAFWQAHKERILAGHVHDVFPYDPGKRFRAQRQTVAEAHEVGIWSLRDWLEIATFVVTIVALPFAVYVFLKEQRKERENEEEEAYLHLSDAYNDFLKIVLANADLQLRTNAALPNPTRRAERAHADDLRHADLAVRAGLPRRVQGRDVADRAAPLELVGRLDARMVPPRRLPQRAAAAAARRGP